MPIWLLCLLPAGDVDFDADVLPILMEHCFHCHGPDAGTREADLRLDRHDDVLFVVEPGDAAASELFGRIATQNSERIMPPPEYGKPLIAEQIETLRSWIEQGAAWGEHWAFEPLQAEATKVPSIDALIDAGLTEVGIPPAPEAEPHTWLRRVSFDLTGLPPTLAQLDAFTKDILTQGREHASLAVVDRLLASEARAEHRTRQWLDIARYADTNGYQNDFRRDQWPWRDWVLRSFRDNLPYDRFVAYQVAGDLLAPSLPKAERLDAVLATGFQRNHRSVTEAGSIDEEWRVENVADRTETTATAFLGLTLACARCHDHKYDQLTQRDYYSFYAFFNSVDEKGVYEETRGNVPPLLHVPSAQHGAELGALEVEVDRGRDALGAAEEGLVERWQGWRSRPQPDAPEMAEPRLTHAPGAAIALSGVRSEAPDLGRVVSFERDQPFSVSLWLKPSQRGAVYSRMNDDDSYRGADLVLLDGLRPAVHLIHDWPENAIKVVGQGALRPHEWNHVAVVYDGSGSAGGVRLYLDTQAVRLDVERDSLKGTTASEEPLRLGTRRYAGELKGELAEFRVHGSALDVGEVRALARLRSAAPDAGAAFFGAAFDEPLRSAREGLRTATAARDAARDGVPTAMVLRDLDEPRVTRVLERGAYDRPQGAPLRPDIPAVFGGLGAELPRDRRGLARWLTAPSNPLVARVAVNRTWEQFFGAGLVRSLDDFGVRGDRPQQRELLDALSEGFIASGFDLRALERRIVLSAAYGRSSRMSAPEHKLDRANRHLSRGPRHRLDAEVVRDSALSVAGLLAPGFGGPSVKPYQPEGLWLELAGGAGQGKYVPSSGADLFRRSVYTYRKRTVPHPTLATFDAPTFELCTVKRDRTNTPLQALAVLNDVTYVEAARHVARRMMQSGLEPGGRLAFGMRLMLSRPPTAREQEQLVQALGTHLAELTPEQAVELLGVGATAPPLEERTVEWAAYTLLASTLQNVDEALSKR